jgi:hypothetical protein
LFIFTNRKPCVVFIVTLLLALWLVAAFSKEKIGCLEKKVFADAAGSCGRDVQQGIERGVFGMFDEVRMHLFNETLLD